MDWSTLHLLLLLIIIHHCSSLCYTSHIVLYITHDWKNTVLTHGEVESIKKKKKKKIRKNIKRTDDSQRTAFPKRAKYYFVGTASETQVSIFLF